MDPSFSHFVFVDFENVPTIDLDLVRNQPAQVLLFIGAKQKNFSFPLVDQIHRLGTQIRLVAVGKSGHNALDLVLAYHLGRAAQEHPGAQFHIVSKDTDFDPLVNHMRTAGLPVSRLELFAALPFLPAPAKSSLGLAKAGPATSKSTPDERRAKFIARLKNPGTRNRPSKKATLLAHVRNDIAKDASAADVEEFVQSLLDQHVLAIDEKGRVTYPA